MEHTTAPMSDTTPHETSAATGLRRSMFERRNRFTLRLGRRTAIPVILALHDPKSFNEVIFQTILSLMKDKIIKCLQYDPYHGQLRVVSDPPSPSSPIQCTELQSAHHLTLLYYFTPHEPPSFVVRNTSLTVLRTGPALQAAVPNKASDSTTAEQINQDEDDEHVSDDERSWHSLHANDEEDEGHDEGDDHELYEDDGTNNNNDNDKDDYNEDHDTDQHAEMADEEVMMDEEHNEDMNEHTTADDTTDTSSIHHVRGYESVRLLSHVLVLETISSEHSLTHLLSQQARDSSPPPVHHLSRYFRAEQSTPSKKRKSAGSDSTRGRKKAKK